MFFYNSQNAFGELSENMSELVTLQVERTLMIARESLVVGEEKQEPVPSFAAFWSVETVCGNIDGLCHC